MRSITDKQAVPQHARPDGRQLLRRAAGVLVAILGAIAVLTAPALAATGTPVWDIQSSAQPTTFQTAEASAGNDRYLIQINNIGTATSSGKIVVTDKLPAGVTTTTTTPFAVAGAGGAWSCSGGAGQVEVICESSSSYPSAATVPYGTDVSTADSPSAIAVPVSVASTATGDLANTVTVSGGGANDPASATSSNSVNTPAGVGYNLSLVAAHIVGPEGAADTQAGGHPYAVTVDTKVDEEVALGVSSNAALSSSENESYVRVGGAPKSYVVDLPLGLVGNPQATPQCPIDDLAVEEGASATKCPPDTEVGDVFLAHESTETGPAALFNLVPEAGHAAMFGFKAETGIAVILDGTVIHTASGYVLRVTSSVPNIHAVNLFGVEATFFGDPAAVFNGNYSTKEKEEAKETPFLSNPVDCAASEAERTLRMYSDNWQEPAAGDDELLTVTNFSDPNWGAGSSLVEPVSECAALHFEPSLGMAPGTGTLAGSGEAASTQADEPSAYAVNLQVPQTEAVSELATPELKTATVTLPEGLTISPSAAAGLEGCTEEELDIESPRPGSCPLGSKIGTVEVTTPLLPGEPDGSGQLKGSVYLAQPGCDAEGQSSLACEAAAEEGKLFGIYIEVTGVENGDHEPGVVIKLPGRVEAGGTGAHSSGSGLAQGQLRAVFEANPQLPFSDLRLSFFGGPRAPLANPQTCGNFTTVSDLEPWSAPATPTTVSDSPFAITGCGASMPFAPSFSAGTASDAAASYSPLSVGFARDDGEQDLSGITVNTPPGLLGKIAGIPQCGEAQANAGTCPAASQIGTTTVAAGPGGDPLTLTGQVYLTGPYKGGPFGLSIVVPANAGPFHLGDVVVRASIAVNPHTAALTITSDPLPQYVDGVQLRLRAVNVEVNRPGFTLNATDCAQQAITASFTAAQGASSSSSTPYYANGCANLAFSPTLTATTSGKTSRKAGASLTVKIAYPSEGQANVSRVHVQLPKKLPARQSTLEHACPEASFDANPATCPALSVIGHAKAVTPLLSVPLEGPAYYVSHGGAAFPEIVAVLQGEGITIDLAGENYISPKGIITSTFASVPDAPISSFELTLPQGSDSVLAANNGNVCEGTLPMPTTIDGQNGKVIEQTTKIKATGCPKKTTGKVKITKHKVKGTTVTLTVKAPAKGKLTASGSGLKKATKSVKGAASYKLKVKLTKAEQKKLKTKKKLTLTVKAAFKPDSGKSSSASVKVKLKS